MAGEERRLAELHQQLVDVGVEATVRLNNERDKDAAFLADLGVMLEGLASGSVGSSVARGGLGLTGAKGGGSGVDNRPVGADGLGELWQVEVGVNALAVGQDALIDPRDAKLLGVTSLLKSWCS